MNGPARRVVIALIVVLAVAVTAVVAPPAAAASSTVVISQVYGGAGCTTAGCSTYKNDFIELFNRGSVPVSLNGWSVQYASATGSFNAATALGNVTLQPGQYYLVAEAFNNNGVNAIPTADSTGTIAMGATAGKVIVANTATALGCGATGTTPAPCSATQQASIIDLIGFGTSATLFEGTGPAPAPSTTTADLRGSSGCAETDQNAADFSAGAPSPRNTASTFASCPDAAPSVASTVPTAGAAGVALAADITVTFTEPVNVAAGWYGVSCATSGTHTATVSGGPTVFTINPDADFVAGESCTATIYAANVTDQDLIDPPDNMASNYVWTFSAAVATPALTINDVTAVEGNSGQTTFTFTVGLSVPAPAGGVTFNLATQDNTATTADNDYVANSVNGATIPAGSSTYTFNVLVNGDTTVEPNETFFVNVTGVTGATVGDGQGVGTITNDDFTLTPIHDIQGNGPTSPIVGTSVTTRGVVTGVRTDGFFIQEPDASVDADPLTSEGILVYTGAPAPAAAVVGNYVQVGGTVQEYAPAADPYQDPLTEISGAPTVSILSTGVPLPNPIDLTTTLPGTGGSLERYEGMLVRVPRMTTVAPTQGSFSSSTGTPGLGTGVFYGVVEGVARPFRQPGIEAPPAVTPPLPEWDPSPQVIRVDSDAIGGARINIPARSTLTNVVGPLDYAYRRYTIVPLPSQPPVVETTFAGLDVPTPASSEFTVGSFNLENFGVGENATFLPIRMAKASLAIRNSLKTPDVLGIVEIKDLATLTSLANQVNADAVAASQPNPLYVPYLIPGANTSINVGFLVKTAPVVGTTPRVSVPAGVVYAEGDGTFTNADGSTTFLNDRPSLRLMAVVNQANGASFPVTVIVNHLRSLIGVDDTKPPSGTASGWATEGARVRAKRKAQAEFLANLVQARQAANPAERIVLVGDFNAYEFNDGYVDVMNTIAGTPSADAVTVVPGDGADLVNPDLVNLLSTSADERYSYVQEDTPQSIDHVVANGALVSATVARHLEHARIDADFPENTRNVSTNALRISDHDPVLAYFQVAAFATADLAVTATDAPDPVTAGSNLTYTITVTNIGPDAAATASFSDTLPAGTTFVSLPAVAEWTCTTPAVGSGGTVSCSNPSFAAGSAVFTLTVAVAPSVTAGTVLSNTATATSFAADANAANNSTTATTTVSALPTAVVTATKSVSGALSLLGTVTYTIVLTNSGTSVQADNPGNELTDVLPAGLTLVSATATSGAAVATPATNTVTWNGSIPAGGTVTVSVVATVRPDVTVGTTISNQATISYDLNADGVNEATGVTDDPATPAAGDATSFAAAAAGTAVIPTLGGVGLGTLALLVALGGALVVGRRLL